MRLIDADKLNCKTLPKNLYPHLKSILDFIDSQPIVEERKVGKWIYDKTSQNWRCSECNETPKTMGYVGTSAFMTEHFKFCNHCGAKMRGAENGSN